jgi:Ca2+/Na+ antiporter
MSHLPERKEKICLNCKSVIYGRFCHVCGQENTEPKETFWGLTTHFVYDITHFDGKFFDTTKYLLFRPGFLALEFLRGRRASYLNPIKMYVFTSAFFFIIFFTFILPKEDEQEIEKERTELISERVKLEQQILKAKDSTQKRKLEKSLKKLNKRIRYYGQNGILKVGDDDIDSSSNFNFIGGSGFPKTLQEYDSIQKALPLDKKDGWFSRKMNRKIISINQKYRYNGKAFWYNVNDKFLHSIPQMMFVSLPLVALIFQLLYLRRKQFYFVNHLIFTIYIYIASYILLLIQYSFAGLYGLTGIELFNVLVFLSTLAIFFYVYKAMRRFYQQRRAKTVFKFMLFMFTFMVLMGLLMGVYFLTSAFQI